MDAIRHGKPPEDRQRRAHRPAGEFEGEIREIIRRDVAPMRKLQPDLDGDAAAGNLNSVIQRVSLNSTAEIEKLIAELQKLRDHLQNEGQRVQRELASYAQLNQSAMNSARVLGESLAQWRAAVTTERPAENDAAEQPRG